MSHLAVTRLVTMPDGIDVEVAAWHEATHAVVRWLNDGCGWRVYATANSRPLAIDVVRRHGGGLDWSWAELRSTKATP